MPQEIFDVTKIKGKEVTVGFGSDKNRLVVDWGSGGITFYAGKQSIETAEKEPITVKISPPGVVCEEIGFVKPKDLTTILFFRLGRHRFLSASYMGEGDLHIVYLPDEDDIVLGRSEFMDSIQR
jgi:hypothetical protein